MNKRKCIDCRHCYNKKTETVNFITGDRKKEIKYFCRITNEERDLFTNRTCPGFEKPVVKLLNHGTSWLK